MLSDILIVIQSAYLNMSRRNSLIDPATIVAHGPGLKGGMVGEECKFRIEGTDGGLALSFHIEGPSRPIFETCASETMGLDITYIPTLPVSSQVTERFQLQTSSYTNLHP